jgi:hypothetical protein
MKCAAFFHNDGSEAISKMGKIRLWLPQLTACYALITREANSLMNCEDIPNGSEVGNPLRRD